MQAKKSLYALASASLLCLPALAQDAPPVVEHTPVVALAEAAAPQHASVPAAMAVLVPDDATILLMTSSLTELEQVAASIATDIDPEMAGAVSIDMLMAMALPPGMDPTAIDRTRPMGIAVGPISMGPEPQVYVLVPTSNPEAIKSALPGGGEGFQTRISEGYVGLTMGGTYGAGTGSSPLLGKVPAGLVGMTVDLETILGTMRPVIDSGLMIAQMQLDSMEDDLAAMGLDQGMDISTLMDAYFEMLYGFLDSVTAMHMSIDVDESLIDMRMAYDVAEGSPMTALAQEGGTDLSRMLSLIGDESFAMLMGADMGQLMEQSRGFFEAMLGAYPEAAAEGLLASLDATEELYGMFGSAMAVVGDFTPAGMQFAGYYDGQNQAGILAKYEEMMQAPYWTALGMTYVDTKKGRLGELELTRYTFDYDAAAMLAMSGEELPEEELAGLEQIMRSIYGEQIVMTFTTVGDMGVMAIGGDDAFIQSAIGRVSEPARSPVDMQRLSDLAARSAPFMAYRMDFGRLMTTVVPMLESTMGMPATGIEQFEGTSLPMNMYMAIEPTTWTTGMMIDLIQVGDFARMMESLSGM